MHWQLLWAAADPRRAFHIVLGVVYAAAFASLGVQITGLAGVDGILPAASCLKAYRSAYGAAA